MDDVPHCLKKPRLLAVIKDERVIRHFANKFQGQCWACTEENLVLICHNCTDDYFDTLGGAQVGMELRACAAVTSGRGTDDAIRQAFTVARATEGRELDLQDVMGRQAAYIVKDLDPMEALSDPTAVGRNMSG